MFDPFKSGLSRMTAIAGVLGLSLTLPLAWGQGSALARPLPMGQRNFNPWWSSISEELGIPIPVPGAGEPAETGTTQPTATSTPDETVPIPEVEVETETADVPRFRCEVVGGEYTVMYYPISQPSSGYPWAVPGLMGGGWTPDRRCAEIGRRLESYRPDGLVALQTAVENGYNTICATTEDIPQCRIVLTVPVGENPEWVRDRIFQNLVIADSGQSTQGVYTWVDERSGSGIIEGIVPRSSRRPEGIFLKPFLDPADGGTGTRLQRRFFR
jgi:hypothetical protein